MILICDDDNDDWYLMQMRSTILIYDDDDDYLVLMKIRVYKENEGIDKTSMIMVFYADYNDWYIMPILC